VEIAPGKTGLLHVSEVSETRVKKSEAQIVERTRTICFEACELCKTRRNVVFGSGDPNSRLWLVGEAPGSNEDEQGEKNGLKCRPPNNASLPLVSQNTFWHWEGMLPRHLFQNLLGVLRKLGVKLFCQVKLKLW